MADSIERAAVCGFIFLESSASKISILETPMFNLKVYADHNTHQSQHQKY